MSNRELVVLGTASQAPTRSRNHNGYFLRWDDEGLLFDPGEGTQRQMLFAGITASQITRICITHFHGDHCLGLPGVLARMSLDRVPHTVEVSYPAGSREVFGRGPQALAACQEAYAALKQGAVTQAPQWVGAWPVRSEWAAPQRQRLLAYRERNADLIPDYTQLATEGGRVGAGRRSRGRSESACFHALR